MDENDYYPVRGPIVKIEAKLKSMVQVCSRKDLCEDCKPGYTCAIKTTLSSKLIKYNAQLEHIKHGPIVIAVPILSAWNGNNLDDLLDETYAEDVLQE